MIESEWYPVLRVLHNCFQTKIHEFHQFESNELTLPGVTSCANPLNPSTFAFSHYEQHSLFYFTALAHLGAILPKSAKYSIVIGWKSKN